MDTISDPRFGTFEHDPSLDQYLTEFEGIWLHIDSEQTLSLLHKLFDDLDTTRLEAAGFAARQLLEEKNEDAPEQDISGNRVVLTVAEFAARLTRLEGVFLKDDGTLLLSFDDGGLFFGHIINVKRNASGVWVDAHWAG